MLEAIADPDVRATVDALFERSVAAIHDLARLDNEIFEQWAMTGEAPADTASAQIMLPTERMTTLANRVLASTRSLIGHLNSQGFEAPSASDDADFDFDFDLGGEPSEPVLRTDSLEEEDILGALDALETDGAESSTERWKKLGPELSSVTFALASQLGEFDQRFADALAANRHVQGLRELDDIGNALTDGVLALMGLIGEAFLGDIDLDKLLPGHRSTLGKALLVRRGVADLRRVVGEYNDTIQSSDASAGAKDAAFVAMRQALSDFVADDVYKAMRPADRAELAAFLDELEGATVREVLLSCEGLDKYLQSLAAVSQRSVLIKHDTDRMREIAETLEGALPLVDISAHGALDMLLAAFDSAQALYGYREDLDQLLQERHAFSEDLSSLDQWVDLGRQLAAFVNARLAN